MTPNLLRIGGRDVTVDTTPLQAAAANFRTAKLVQPRDGCLVLRPTIFLRVFAAMFLAIGVIVMAVGVGILIGAEVLMAMWVMVAFGAIFSIVGGLMLLLPRRHEFDRDAGQWTLSHFFSSTSRPLSDILAVQLIDGGHHSSSDGPDYYTFQLNL